MPGFGTVVASFMVQHMDKTQFVVGVTQIMLTPFLIGYLWSLYWAYLMVIKAGTGGSDQEKRGLFGAEAGQPHKATF